MASQNIRQKSLSKQLHAEVKPSELRYQLPKRYLNKPSLFKVLGKDLMLLGSFIVIYR